MLVLIIILQMLPEIGYQLLHNYAKPIEEWGWRCNIHAQGSGSFKRYLLSWYILIKEFDTGVSFQHYEYQHYNLVDFFIADFCVRALTSV